MALYWVLWVIMAYVPEDYQPIMAVVIPLFREGLVAILKMIGSILMCKSFSAASWFQPSNLVSFQVAAALEKWSPRLSSR